MPKSFLWINKDLNSEKLSQSLPAEESLVRRHAQQNRVRAPQEGTQAQQAILQQNGGYIASFAGDSIPRSLLPTNLSLTSDESRSLAFFVSRTAPDWTGWDDASFWNSEVLQAGQRSKAIAHGLISLSTIHESLENVNNRTALRYLSLKQLSKAIQELNSPELSYMDALISCIVLICVQNSQNGRQSYQFLRAGETILHELDFRLSAGSVILSSSEHTILESYIRPLVDHLRARLCAVGDPVAALAISVEAHCRPSTICKPKPSVPRWFTTLRDARDCLGVILDWGCSNLGQSTSPEPSSSGNLPLRQLCASWEKALYSSSTLELSFGTLAAHRSSKLMHIGCLFGRILIECFGTTSECIYDNYLPEFATIVQLAEETAQVSEMSFGIDSGLVDILASVGQCCRDPQIRRAAMTYLARGHRIEGDRVSLIAARILGTLIDLEEKDLVITSCHDILDARRWRVSQGAQFLNRGQLRIDLVKTCDPESSLQVWIPLSIPGVPEIVQGSEPLDPPDVVFGGGFVDFLDDSRKGGYFRFSSESFYFPIPRV